jgi:hypothetical protein
MMQRHRLHFAAEVTRQVQVMRCHIQQERVHRVLVFLPAHAGKQSAAE